MMQREFVDLRGWISRQEFLDMLGVVNLIPGPNSTELAIHIGYRLGGRMGLLLAGLCFISPAFLIVLALAWLYRTFGARPDVELLLSGAKPVVLAVIAQAVWKLLPPLWGRPRFLLLAAGVFVAGLLGVHELLLLLGSGVAGLLLRGRRDPKPVAGTGSAGGESSVTTGSDGRTGKRGPLLASGVLAALLGLSPVGSIFLYFLYVGSVLYGSGYVLVAFLHDDLVGKFGWLTNRQLLDAVAVGQLTPGPVFTTATFIGFILGGFSGSVAATVGIFLPSFLFVLLLGEHVVRLRSNPAAAGFLDGVNSGALALIAVALALLARGTLLTPLSWVVLILAAAILALFRINPTWVILAGAVTGWVAGQL
jgi:chromate transporter